MHVTLCGLGDTSITFLLHFLLILVLPTLMECLCPVFVCLFVYAVALPPSIEAGSMHGYSTCPVLSDLVKRREATYVYVVIVQDNN